MIDAIFVDTTNEPRIEKNFLVHLALRQIVMPIFVWNLAVEMTRSFEMFITTIETISAVIAGAYHAIRTLSVFVSTSSRFYPNVLGCTSTKVNIS